MAILRIRENAIGRILAGFLTPTTGVATPSLPGDTDGVALAFVLVDPTTGLPIASGANPNANPATIYSDQQAVTASAVALTTQAFVNGFVLKAKSTNTGNVFVGGSDVNTTDDGSGNGYRLLPGESISYGVSTTAGVFIIGTASDVVYVTGS